MFEAKSKNLHGTLVVKLEEKRNNEAFTTFHTRFHPGRSDLTGQQLMDLRVVPGS